MYDPKNRPSVHRPHIGQRRALDAYQKRRERKPDDKPQADDWQAFKADIRALCQHLWAGTVAAFLLIAALVMIAAVVTVAVALGPVGIIIAVLLAILALLLCILAMLS